MNINNLLEDCNEEQKKFILEPLANAKLIGIPGGGKTTTIVKKILYHKLNKDLKDNYNYIIVTFSKKACTDFISRGSNIDSTSFNTTNVRTIHSLAGSITMKINNKQISSLDIVVASANDIVKRCTVKELKTVKLLSKLKLIVVDEAQDISAVQYELIKNISEKLKANLIMVGDPNQNIYQFQNGSDRYLMNYEGTEHVLIKNHRSTKEIVDVVNIFRPWKLNMAPMTAVKGQGKKPVIYHGDTQTDVLYYVLEEIYKGDVKLEDIALIGPVKACRTTADGKFVNMGLSFFVNYFERNKIKYVKHYKDTTKDAEISNEDNKTKEGHINLHTIHSSKGLEFKKVILLNFHFMTKGKRPTQEEYNEIKYMWYVALSRAKEELIILVDKNKNIWYDEDFYRNTHLFEIKSRNKEKIFSEKPKFGENMPVKLNVTELIGTKEIFTEEALLYFNNNLNFVNIPEKIYDVDLEQKFEKISDYSSLYGLYIESLAEYYYAISHDYTFEYPKRIKKILENSVEVDGEYSTAVNLLMCRMGIINGINGPITLDRLNKSKHKFSPKEIQLFEELCKLVKNKYLEFYINYQNINIHYDNEYIINKCNEILNLQNEKENNMNRIFEIVLYMYQREPQIEGKYLWNMKEDLYKMISESIKDILPKIEDYMSKINRKLIFQKYVSSKYIERFNGMIDAYDMTTNKIIEFKFTKSINLTHMLQIWFYNCIMHPNWEELKEMEIINFQTGYKYTIIANPKINHFEMLLKIVDLVGTKEKIKLNNVVMVYDLETTGLIDPQGNIPDIIDRHFYEPNMKCTIDTGLVKPHSMKVSEVSESILRLTNIDRKDLEKAENFYEFKNNMIKKISSCSRPKLIAHNGNSFDHKILRRESIINYDCDCYDSITLVSNFYLSEEERLTSLKLTYLYEKIVCKSIQNAHRAYGDVIMLHEVLKKINAYGKMYWKVEDQVPKYKVIDYDKKDNQYRYKIVEELEEFLNNKKNTMK